MQRSGDLRTFASLTAEAEEIAQQIEALEGQSA